MNCPECNGELTKSTITAVQGGKLYTFKTNECDCGFMSSVDDWNSEEITKPVDIEAVKSLRGKYQDAKTSTMETVFSYSGRIYVRPMGRGIVLGEDEELDDAVPAGDYVAEIVIRKAVEK